MLTKTYGKPAARASSKRSTLTRPAKRQHSTTDEVPGRPGRPPKFGRSARAITLTLPEDIITALHAVHVDPGHAVVRLVENCGQWPATPRSAAQLASFGSNALILIDPVTTLRRFRGVELVTLPDGRALILLDPGTSPLDLEVGLRDAIEEGHVRQRDLRTVQAVANLLKTARQSKGLGVTERSVIVVKLAKLTGEE